MSDAEEAKDTRMVCKYGSKCYQKNPAHHVKYKHPPRKGTIPDKKVANKVKPQGGNKRKSDEDLEEEDIKKPKVSNDVSDSDSESPKLKLTDSDQEMADFKISNDVSDSESEMEKKPKKPVEKAPDSNSASVSNLENKIDYKNLPEHINAKEFIKEKFLCEMPEDFYQFWDFCKELKKENPSEALSGVGLHLVGPYDVLGGKFNGIKDRSSDEYLIHWRYFYDPPELQTVVSGDKPEGFHIGYFRDDMKKNPVFLASNCSKKDGTFEIIGDNIFTAVYLHLDDAKKTCDPFKKSQIASLLGKLKSKVDQLHYSLSRRTDEIRKRKVVAVANSRLGLSVPYDRRSDVGYRELTLNDKAFINLMSKMKVAHPDQFNKLMDELQPVLTNTNIALDESDFGTGVKLGWELIFFGVEKLNNIISQYLVNSYNLLGRPELGQIAKAHMKNRRKSTKPSVL